MSSAAQAAASRFNGALSHGPTSEEGKATSSLNALTTGLTGRTVLLPPSMPRSMRPISPNSANAISPWATRNSLSSSP